MSKKIIEYTVVSGFSLKDYEKAKADLIKKVNAKLKDGWEPLGGVVSKSGYISGGVVCRESNMRLDQAMVRFASVIKR